MNHERSPVNTRLYGYMPWNLRLTFVRLMYFLACSFFHVAAALYRGLMDDSGYFECLLA